MMALGIDPGTTTGLALWDASPRAFNFLWIESMGIIESMNRVNAVRDMCKANSIPFVVVIEDARQRTWFGATDKQEGKFGAGVREGVGSVKRDCRIWEEFLTLREIPFEMRKPAGTKYNAAKFATLTGWQHSTNEHQRDAGMIVFQLNDSMICRKIQTATQREQQPECVTRVPAGARFKTRRRSR